MTGILPIKKDGSQSAISDFREFSVLDPGEYAVFTGFTEDEVFAALDEFGLSEQKEVSFTSAKLTDNTGIVPCSLRKRSSFQMESPSNSSAHTYAGGICKWLLGRIDRIYPKLV